jgi:hypothetical protein
MYSLPITLKNQNHHQDSIYSSAFLLGGDIPIAIEAVRAVLVVNIALSYHHEGLACNHRKSFLRFQIAKVFYEEAHRSLLQLFQEKPRIRQESMALRVLFAAICCNLSNIHLLVFCDPTAALSYMRQFQSIIPSIILEEENLPASDVQFFQRSRLFYAEDMDRYGSPFMFSPAA